MTLPYRFAIDHGFEDSAGEYGANRERYAFWLEALTKAVPSMLACPQREAEPLLSLPSREDDLPEIEEIAAHIRGHCGALVVAGLGGSSLSGETLAFLRREGAPALLFLDNIDPHATDSLMESLDWKHTAFLIISKSGQTVETLAQMAVLLRRAGRDGVDIAGRFFVITVLDGNPLHRLAKTHGMRVVAHDPSLGGRFSILSAVGLIPAAVAGIDIRCLRAGARSVLSEHVPAMQGAALHRALMEKNIRIHVTMYYGDRFAGLAAWHRQCWGESLGKCGIATTPVRSRGATDQHSQLQLYLDGPKDKLFSLLTADHAGQGARIDYEENNDPRLDFLKGRRLGDLMAAQQRATLDTLIKRGCPVRRFIVKEVNEEAFGALLMHFALEIMFLARLMEVNAFDQPAVEEGKILALRYLAETPPPGVDVAFRP